MQYTGAWDNKPLDSCFGGMVHVQPGLAVVPTRRIARPVILHVRARAYMYVVICHCVWGGGGGGYAMKLCFSFCGANITEGTWLLATYTSVLSLVNVADGLCIQLYSSMINYYSKTMKRMKRWQRARVRLYRHVSLSAKMSQDFQAV